MTAQNHLHVLDGHVQDNAQRHLELSVRGLIYFWYSDIQSIFIGKNIFS